MVGFGAALLSELVEDVPEANPDILPARASLGAQWELEVSVGEMDMGQVVEGLEAEFTVDVWPRRKSLDQGLRPGMISTATIITKSRADALCRD